MKKVIEPLFCLMLILITSKASNGQSNKEKALEKGQAAIKLMDDGKLDESIKLLEEAQQLDPERFDYPYEMAYAYYEKEDYNGAIKILESNRNHADVTEKLLQLLGNSYDMTGKPEKAIETYDAGLKKFPASGELYLEKGNMHWAKKEYSEALGYYEKGIEVEPEFPSNYYRATLIYCSSSEEVWGMIYGELFMNMERNTKRTEEISKILFDTYKSEIKFTSDSSFSVSFSQNATMNIEDVKNADKPKLPFGIGVYEPTLMFSIFLIKTIGINTLNEIRSKFIANYYQKNLNKEYPNILFAYQKQVKDAGHIEAYNYWILMKGDEEGFDKWKSANEEKWKSFVDWFGKNKVKINESNKFFSGQY